MKRLRKMVVGFLVDSQRQYVVLIHKVRPPWMAGRFNGVGGHVEKGETPQQAMIRECEEEIGIVKANWRHFATLKHYSRGGWVYFFVAEHNRLEDAVTKTDEGISIQRIDALPTYVMPNLRWLIPMALDKTLTEPIEITDRGIN